MLSWPAVFLVGAHDGGDDGGDDGDDGGVAQHGGHNPNNGLIEICCPDLPCTFLIY